MSKCIHPLKTAFWFSFPLSLPQVTQADFPALEDIFRSIVKEKQPFERLVVKKEDLLEMFKVVVSSFVCMSEHGIRSHTVFSGTSD